MYLCIKASGRNTFQRNTFIGDALLPLSDIPLHPQDGEEEEKFSQFPQNLISLTRPGQPESKSTHFLLLSPSGLNCRNFTSQVGQGLGFIGSEKRLG